MHRDLRDCLFHPRRALDANLALAKLKIAGACLKHMPGYAKQFLLNHASGANYSTGHHHCETAAPRPGTRESVIGVRVDDADIVRMDLELLCQDHSRHGLWAVAPERCVQRNHDFP